MTTTPPVVDARPDAQLPRRLDLSPRAGTEAVSRQAGAPRGTVGA